MGPECPPNNQAPSHTMNQEMDSQKTIKKELVKDYDKFIVKLIQLYYDDDNDKYKKKKTEEITDLVCI